MTSSQPTRQSICIDVTYLNTSQGCPDVDELRQLLAVARAGNCTGAARITGRDRRVIGAAWDRFAAKLARELERVVLQVEAGAQ